MKFFATNLKLTIDKICSLSCRDRVKNKIVLEISTARCIYINEHIYRGLTGYRVVLFHDLD